MANMLYTREMLDRMTEFRFSLDEKMFLGAPMNAFGMDTKLTRIGSNTAN